MTVNIVDIKYILPTLPSRYLGRDLSVGTQVLKVDVMIICEILSRYLTFSSAANPR